MLHVLELSSKQTTVFRKMAKSTTNYNVILYALFRGLYYTRITIIVKDGSCYYTMTIAVVVMVASTIFIRSVIKVVIMTTEL